MKKNTLYLITITSFLGVFNNQFAIQKILQNGQKLLTLGTKNPSVNLMENKIIGQMEHNSALTGQIKKPFSSSNSKKQNNENIPYFTINELIAKIYSYEKDLLFSEKQNKIKDPKDERKNSEEILFSLSEIFSYLLDKEIFNEEKEKKENIKNYYLNEIKNLKENDRKKLIEAIDKNFIYAMNRFERLDYDYIYRGVLNETTKKINIIAPEILELESQKKDLEKKVSIDEAERTKIIKTNIENKKKELKELEKKHNQESNMVKFLKNSLYRMRPSKKIQQLKNELFYKEHRPQSPWENDWIYDDDHTRTIQNYQKLQDIEKKLKEKNDLNDSYIKIKKDSELNIQKALKEKEEDKKDTEYNYKSLKKLIESYR